MQAEKPKWWGVGGIVVAMIGLGLWLNLGLTPAQNEWSALGMLLWVMLASLAICYLIGTTTKHLLCQRFIVLSTALSWFMLGFCAPVWHITLPFFKGPSSLVLVFLPVALLQNVLVLPMSVDAKLCTPEYCQRLEYLRRPLVAFGMCCVAVGNLIGFFGQTSLATKLFLEFFVVVSALNLQRHLATKR